jgi:psiF repeat
MVRSIALAAALLLALPIASSFAVTSKEKAATCKFGADDQKLKGKARTAFMAKCMSNKNDPRGHAVAPAGAGGADGVPPPPKQ